MSHNYIGPPGGRALAEAFEANRKFTRLHLGANRFRDEGAIALAGAVRANTALRNLTLSFNGVKAKGAAALAAVLANNGSSLRALELGGNPRIKAETLAAIRARLGAPSDATPFDDAGRTGVFLASSADKGEL